MQDTNAAGFLAPDLTGCDREPIHIPGSIQPHGVLLVVDIGDLAVTHAAGDVRHHLGADSWIGRPLAALLGPELAERAFAIANATHAGGFVSVLRREGASQLDVSAHLTGQHLIVECEATSSVARSSAVMLGQLEAAGQRFEAATSLRELCETAAAEFRKLTGYDRVMIYTFLDDDAGVVLAEDRQQGLHSFLHHRFPASDIPKQARALYLRNLVRVIPDVTYQAAPLEPPWPGDAPLDMSDCHLRSVSPIHLQYLQNMNVGASASISIIKDGVLWGLVACHNSTPRMIPNEIRAACRVLAGSLSRQIKSREDTDAYRERLRLRGNEDDIVTLLAREGSLDEALSNHLDDMRKFLVADGIMVMRSGAIVTAGNVPPEAETSALAAWLIGRSTERVFATDRLPELYRDGARFQDVAAGVLAVTLSTDDRWLLVWFRAEEVQIVKWAGNPHKTIDLKPGEILSPRASFEAWQETVNGRSRRWTPAEIEAAGRIRRALVEVRQTRRVRDLNKQLQESLDEKNMLLQQKEFLIGEVNHRVQNSLSLVSSFLGLQARDSDDDKFEAAIAEARRRIGAVSLMYRRLYRGDHDGMTDVGRYVSELCDDVRGSMGAEWSAHFVVDVAPIMMPTDRAVSLGLVLTELIININKYAYDGQPGPVHVTLTEDRARFRLIVADRGKGRASSRQGFGSRMMSALVGQLGGELDYADNNPGLKATLIAPVEASAAG